MNRIAAVIVTYQPDLQELQALLDALRSQVQWLIVVDNGSDMDVAGMMREGEVFLPLHENQGIAAAQNMGMEHALTLGAEYIYLSDQDSLPPPGMVAVLAAAHRQAAQEKDAPVAAVGPLMVDARTGTPHRFMVEHQGWLGRWPRRFYPAEHASAVNVGFLLASGSLLPAAAVRTIGGLRSNYFIDHVDLEWCYRARAAGWRLVGVPAARLRHTVGESVRRVWFFRWRQVLTHSPLRDYYAFRNTMLTLRDTPVGWGWRRDDLWRLVLAAGYFLMLGEQRISRARLMSLGLWHGLRGRSGRLDRATGRLTPIAMTALDPR